MHFFKKLSSPNLCFPSPKSNEETVKVTKEVAGAFYQIQDYLMPEMRTKVERSSLHVLEDILSKILGLQRTLARRLEGEPGLMYLSGLICQLLIVCTDQFVQRQTKERAREMGFIEEQLYSELQACKERERMKEKQSKKREKELELTVMRLEKKAERVIEENRRLREQLNESVQKLNQIWSRAEHEIVLNNFETAIEEVETVYSQVLTERHKQFGALHKIRMLIGRAAQECYTKVQKETQTEEWISSQRTSNTIQNRSLLETKLGSALYDDLQLHLPPLLKPAGFDFKSLQFIREYVYTALPKQQDFYSFSKEAVFRMSSGSKIKALAQTVSFHLSAQQLVKQNCLSPFPSLTLFLFQTSSPSSILEHLMARHKDIILLFFLRASQPDLQRVQQHVHQNQSRGLQSLSLLDCYTLMTDVLDKYTLFVKARILQVLHAFVLDKDQKVRALVHSPQSLMERWKKVEERDGKQKRVSLIKAKLLFLQPCFLKELQEALMDKKQNIVGEISKDFWKDFMRQHYSQILSEKEVTALSQEFFPGIIEHIDFHTLAQDLGDFSHYRSELRNTEVSVNTALNALYAGLRGLFHKKTQEWFSIFKKFNKLELGVHKLHSLSKQDALILSFSDLCRQLIRPEPSLSQIKALFLKTCESNFMGVEKFNLHAWLELLITDNQLSGISTRSGYKQSTPLFAGGGQLTVQLIPPTDEDSSNCEEEGSTLMLPSKTKKRKPGLKNRSLSFRPCSSKPTGLGTSSVLNLPKATSAY